MELKTGKLPAKHNPKNLLLSDYLDVAAILPKAPVHFGHENLIKNWGMLGNDTAGDCVWAGGAHETILLNKEAGRDIPFTTQSVFSDYADATGFVPSTGANDNGTDVGQAMKYRRDIGLLDANGNRHKIGAYLSLEPGNLEHIYAAIYLFGAVGIGIEFPESAMQQFNAAKPWKVVKGSRLDGGHYIPLIAKRTNLEVVTWGRIQEVELSFFKKYCDEAFTFLTPEIICSTGKSIDGFDLATLQADLKAL